MYIILSSLDLQCVEPTQCCRTRSLYRCASSCSLTQLLPDSTDSNSHTAQTSSVSFSFPNIQLKKFYHVSFPFQITVVQSSLCGCERVLEFEFELPLASLHNGLGCTLLPHPTSHALPTLPHLAAIESSSVGRTLAPHRLAPRWLHP